MLVKTYCLAGDAALRAAPPPARDALLHRVLRRIATDSVTAEQAQHAIAPRAERLQAVLECAFPNADALRAACAQPQWQAFEASLIGSGELLFGFESHVNVPIAPLRAAVDGGFRRWMLLKRAADGVDAFRQAWFGRHAQLVQRLPHVEGYVQQLVTAHQGADGAPVPYDQLQVDGIAQLCYADEAAMGASYASEARLPLRDDGLALLAGNITYLVQGERLR